MKKLLFTLLALLPLSTFAQKLLSNKVEQDGTRYIICSDEPCRNMSDKIVLSVSLGAMVVEDHSDYLLSVQFSTAAKPSETLSIPDNADLLIKTADDAVLQLKCNAGDTDELGEVQNIAGMVMNMKIVNTSAKVTEDDIAHLLTGITKVRCTLTSDKLDNPYYEGSFKKAKLAKFLKAEKEIVDQVLATSKSGDITEGF